MKTSRVEACWLHVPVPQAHDARVTPSRLGVRADALVPALCRLILGFRVFPGPPLGLDNPVGFAFPGPLRRDPIRVVEADDAAWFQVIDLKLRA